MDRAVELREIYDALKDELTEADGSGRAAIARELRILSAELAGLERPEKERKVDEVARRRDAKAGADRPPARRRESRRGTSGD